MGKIYRLFYVIIEVLPHPIRNGEEVDLVIDFLSNLLSAFFASVLFDIYCRWRSKKRKAVKRKCRKKSGN